MSQAKQKKTSTNIDKPIKHQLHEGTTLRTKFLKHEHYSGGDEVTRACI